MNHQHEEPKIVIKGIPALIIIALVMTFFLWRILVTNDTVAPELEELVRQQLAAEYMRHLLPSIEEGVATKDNARLEADVERLKSYKEDITFTTTTCTCAQKFSWTAKRPLWANPCATFSSVIPCCWVTSINRKHGRWIITCPS